MARKKPEKKEVPTTEVPKVPLKLVRLELPSDYHRDLRVIAAKRESTMAVVARKVIQEFIDQERKAGKV